MEMAKISSKGPISIPRAIREAACLGPGDRVGFEVRDHEILLIPLPARAIRDLRGAWRAERPMPDVEALRAQRAADWALADREATRDA
jgi:AbrB family looped-hinge helix DNA binding protein